MSPAALGPLIVFILKKTHLTSRECRVRLQAHLLRAVGAEGIHPGPQHGCTIVTPMQRSAVAVAVQMKREETARNIVGIPTKESAGCHFVLI